MEQNPENEQCTKDLLADSILNLYWFGSCFVENPEERFCRDEAHFKSITSLLTYLAVSDFLDSQDVETKFLK